MAGRERKMMCVHGTCPLHYKNILSNFDFVAQTLQLLGIDPSRVVFGPVIARRAYLLDFAVPNRADIFHVGVM